MATAVAALDLQGGFGNVELFGQELEAHLIGSPVHRRGGESDFKRLVVDAGHRVSGCAGLDVDAENIAVFVFFDQLVHGCSYLSG